MAKIKTCIVDENAQWFGPSDNRRGKPEVKVANEETKLRSRPPANRGEAEQVQLDHLDAVVAGGGDDLLDGGLPALPAAATHDDLGTTSGKVACGLQVVVSSIFIRRHIINIQQLPHLETYPTVGSSDDDQLTVQPLLPPIDPHRQLLPQPEGDHQQGCVEGGRGEEGEKCGHHRGIGSVGQSSGFFLKGKFQILSLFNCSQNL